MTISLTLQPVKSKLNNITCIEIINNKILDKLINSNLLLKDPWNGYENEKEQLKKYKSTKGNIVYKKVCKFGRTFCKLSAGLQSLRKEIRHTIAKDNYIDIDITNCHPVLLLQILKMNNYPNIKYLEKYVNDREEYLNTIIDKYNTTRDEAKQLFIRLLYGGKFESWAKDHKIRYDNIPKFIEKFYNEIQAIQLLITNSNKELKETIDKQKNDNVKDNTVLSYYLQEIEHRILEDAYLYCCENGYILNNHCVLIFDGFMIEKHFYKPELLTELTNLVYKKYGLNLEFLEKEMNHYFTDEEINNSQVETFKSYEDLKEEFEKYNFKIRNPLLYIEINKITGELIKRSKQEFLDVNNNVFYNEIDKIGDNKKLLFVKQWMKDENIRSYNNFDFLPCEEAPDHIYNTFNGFYGGQKESNNNKIENSLFWKHYKNVVCNGSEETFNYLNKWIANIIQQPLKKCGIAMVLKGDQGSGKDTFTKFLEKLIGDEYYENTDNPDLVFGKFNGTIENKILCVLNETSGKDTFIINENIKDAITRNKTNIHNKMMKPYTVKDACSYIFLTNNNNPLKIPADDRRFFCVEMSNEYKNDLPYFTELYKELNSEEYLKSYFDFFNSIDITDYDFINNRPVSNMYDDMRELNIPVAVRFLENYIYETLNTIDVKPFWIDANVLFSKFDDYTVKNKYVNLTYNPIKFGIEISKFDGIEKKRSNRGITYGFDKELLKSYLTEKYKIEFVENKDTDFDED